MGQRVVNIVAAIDLGLILLSLNMMSGTLRRHGSGTLIAERGRFYDRKRIFIADVGDCDLAAVARFAIVTIKPRLLLVWRAILERFSFFPGCGVSTATILAVHIV